MTEKNVENFCIAATAMVVAITICIVLVTAIHHQHLGDHDRQMKKIEAIRACAKSSEPAVCIAAVHP